MIIIIYTKKKWRKAWKKVLRFFENSTGDSLDNQLQSHSFELVSIAIEINVVNNRFDDLMIGLVVQLWTSIITANGL